MSEYQYYEFQAIDRPLDDAQQAALRAVSSRARITATSFVNFYSFGDFKGDPDRLMESSFDLHLYLANWGTRRLMIRWPARLIDRKALAPFLHGADGVGWGATLRKSGPNLILNIELDEEEVADWDDGTGWLAALAPLRADVLGGDLRLFYLVWLRTVAADMIAPETPEPMPGIGPLNGALEAFASFFAINPDLVAAASERDAAPDASSDAASARIAALSDREKTELLTRLHDGDAHVGHELRARIRRHATSEASEAGPPASPARTAGALRARAAKLRRERERIRAEAAQAERERQQAETERIRRARLEAVARRGEAVWNEIEEAIEQRNAPGYDKAAELIFDLETIAAQAGRQADFTQRVQDIRARHARKRTLIARLERPG